MDTKPSKEHHHFIYDEAKSSSNKAKHGIDFLEAQALWGDEDLTEVDARYETESRSMLTGVIDGRHWTAFVTYRGAATRLISVRRSRGKEVRAYEAGRTR